MHLDLSEWPQIETAGLPAYKKAYADKRQQAIRMYVERARGADIRLKTGLPRQHVHALFNRALLTHEDGRPWGFRVCLHYAHVKPYERLAPLPPRGDRYGFAGALGQLFERYPNILRTLKDLALRKNRGRVEFTMDFTDLHQSFLQLCKAEGIRENEYPRNVDETAYGSLTQKLKKWMNAHAVAMLPFTGGKNAAQKFGSGVRVGRLPMAPYQRAELDGHRFDAYFVIEIRYPNGEVCVLHLERIWILVIRDCGSRAVLGYHIVLKKEYTSEDVLTCLENAIRPWKRRVITIPGLKYAEDGGFPSGSVKGLEYALFNELTFDNAAAHGRKVESYVWTQIEKLVGCQVNPGAVSCPDQRTIEGFFNIFTRHGFQKLPSTTGSNPKDPRRRNPEGNAVKFEVSFEEMEQLTDVYLAEVNGRPNAGTPGRSPLEALTYSVGDKNVSVRQVPEEDREKFNLTTYNRDITVRGPFKKGYVLHVNFEHVAYTSRKLASAVDLENKQIRARINLRNLCSIELFLPDGASFDTVTASGGWGITPHDFRTRKAIFALARRGKLERRWRENPIQAYNAYLQSKIKKGHKRPRNNLAHIQRVAGDGSISKGASVIAGTKLQPRKLPFVRPRVFGLPQGQLPRRAFEY
jgi:putative transposase